VRRANENQSWLAKSPAEIKADPSDWLDKTVLNVDRARVARVDVQPATGPSYSISRAKPADESFTVAPMPKGREMAYPGAADMAAAALADFSFDDIRLASDLDFANAARLTVRTFDGLTVMVDIAKQNDATWARVTASAEPGKPNASREALAITTRAAAWAFKLPPYKATSFAAPLESLLKPKEK
jgi:hypothetical protein